MGPHQRPGSWNRHFFNITIRLTPTKEVFELKEIRPDMTIAELQDHAEFATGIPVHMQQLCYLDEGILQKHTDVRWNDIIPGAQLHMDVWSTWTSLVVASANNDLTALLRLGVTPSHNAYKTPTSEYMTAECKTEWLAERAFIALYIASHRGHLKLCKQLVELGANVNASTPQGRTVLHVAASQGCGKVIDFLLEKGADIDAADINGDTALSISGRYKHKDSERHLFLFRWQQRAMEPSPHVEVARFAHQYFDSATPVWMRGKRSQLYLMQIAAADAEFSGTMLGAPRRRPVVAGRRLKKTDGESKSRDNEVTSQLSNDDQSSTGRRSGGKPAKEVASFDEWLAKKRAIEAVIIEEKRRARAQAKKEAEEKKLDTEMQNKSYEKWLEANPTSPSSGVRSGTKRITGDVIGAGDSDGHIVSMETTQQRRDEKKTGEARTMKEIIRDIMRRREKQAEAMGITHDMWMTMTKDDLYKQVRNRGGYSMGHY